MSELLFKICAQVEWGEATRLGAYRGSPDDLRDGFIRLSRAHQVAGTAKRHFHGRTDLVLVTVRADELGSALRFEPSRGGDLFPHLYGELDTALAVSVRDLPWDGEKHLL